MLEAAMLTPLTLDIAYHQFCHEAREGSWRLDGIQLKNISLKSLRSIAK